MSLDPASAGPAPERRIAELSRRLLGRGERPPDAAIQEALALTGRDLAGADRAWLMTAAGPGQPVRSFGWCAPGVEAALPRTDPATVRSFAWSHGQLAREEVLHIPCVDALPPQAVAERELAASRGVRSVLVIPLAGDGGEVGFLEFECVRCERRWSEHEILRLRIAAEVLAAAVGRQRAADALRESESRFRALAEHAPELISEFGSDGRYLYASPSFQELLGYSPAELIGRHPRELIHPDDLCASTESLTQAMRSEGRALRVHRLRHRDGSWRWFDNSGRTFRTARGELRFVSIARDISERKEMEQTLARQLEFERRIAALSPRFLGLRREEVERGVEDGLRELAGAAGADLVLLLLFGAHGTDWQAFQWCAPGVLPPRIAERPWASPRALAGQVMHFATLADLPPEACEERAELEARGVRSALGIPVQSERRVVGFLGFESHTQERCWSDADIMRLRLAGEFFASALRRCHSEEELRRSQAQLLQAQKMEAVGRLAGGIAHDFNNLLTVIGGNTEWLLADPALPAGAQEDLLEIERAADRAASLTRQLLAFSRRPEGEPRRVDLGELVTDVETLLRRLVGEDVELEIDRAAELGGVEADPGQLEQVLINLAVNARDAMPDGGKLCIRTRRRHVGEVDAQQLGLPYTGEHVVLSVSDTGCGMDGPTRERIFEPFFTTKDPDRGTGLGLSIVYSIVTRCRGAVAVESAPGAGATFHVLLPEFGAAEGVRSAAEPEPAGRGSETLLLVEDEPAVRRLLRRNLESAGYRVLEAADGPSALEVARAHRGDLPLLLSDLVMPGMTGSELCRQLRAERRGLRVLFLSGHPEQRREAAGLQVPARELLRKPIRRDELLRRVRAALDERALAAPAGVAPAAPAGVAPAAPAGVAPAAPAGVAPAAGA